MHLTITYNIYFHEEIIKISVFLIWKSTLSAAIKFRDDFLQFSIINTPVSFFKKGLEE